MSDCNTMFNEALAEALAAERAIAVAQARQLRALARITELSPDPHGSDLFDEFTSCQVAPALNWTEKAAADQLRLAVRLTRRLPGTLTALERGDVDIRRARAIADVTEPLSPEQCAVVEARVLPKATTQTAAELRRSTRRQVIKIDPAGAQRRHERRRRLRSVRVTAHEDGMASLGVYCTAAEAEKAFAHVDDLARACATARDGRTLEQRRADAAIDLLTGRACLCRQGAETSPTESSSGTRTGRVVRGGRTRVHVTVPRTTLMGLDDEPGELAGYGPIPAQLARELAADGTWRRLVTDPLSGAVLDAGTTSYRPPAALAEFVRARDQHCRFPACRRPGRQCDLDHGIRYPTGPTSHTNLCCLCRRHHRLKTKGNWSLKLDQTGVVTWTSPTGRVYVTTPEPVAEPDPTPAAQPVPAGSGRAP